MKGHVACLAPALLARTLMAYTANPLKHTPSRLLYSRTDHGPKARPADEPPQPTPEADTGLRP